MSSIQRHIILILLLCLGAEANAQLLPNFGGQRAGLSSLAFLKNDMNARSSAMGGSSISLRGDVYSTYTNPAGITDLESFSVGISSLPLGDGINQSFLSAVFPRKNQSAFGFSLNMMNSGAMDVRTEFQPLGTGEKFYVTNMYAGLTYAQKLSDMFAAGITLKYIHEQVAEYSNGVVTADVSFLYYTDFKDLKFAVMVQNFGGNSSLNGDELQVTFNRNGSVNLDEYSVPTVFKLGASAVPFKEDKQSLLVSIELNHPGDNAENYRLGLEYEYLKLLFLRAGYRINVEGQPYPTFGFGLRHRVGGHPLAINYGANPTDFLGVLHTVGLSFTLNKMERE